MRAKRASGGDQVRERKSAGGADNGRVVEIRGGGRDGGPDMQVGSERLRGNRPDGISDSVRAAVNNGASQPGAADAQAGDAAGVEQVARLLNLLDEEAKHTLDLQRTSWNWTNLTQFKELFKMREQDFSPRQRNFGGYFLNHWKKSTWMRDQRGYREKIALVLSAKSQFTPMRLAFCRHWKLCLHSLCPRCNYLKKVVPVQYDFAGAFERAAEQKLHFVGLVPSFTFDPDHAGLHFVLRKLPNGKPKDVRPHRPFKGQDKACLLTGEDHKDVAVIKGLLKLLKQYPRLLKNLGLISGAFAQPEYKISFHPLHHNNPTQSRVTHSFLPHRNLTVTTSHRPDWHWAFKCWQAWEQLCKSAGVMAEGAGFPDLFIGRAMDSQQELTSWLSYSLKAAPFEQWYAEGIKNRCHLPQLNMEFSQVFFQAYRDWRLWFKGPYTLGNLHPNAMETDRLVQKRPPRAKIRAIEAKLKLMRDGDEAIELSEEEDVLLNLKISPEFLRFQRTIRDLKRRRAEQKKQSKNSAGGVKRRARSKLIRDDGTVMHLVNPPRLPPPQTDEW